MQVSGVIARRSLLTAALAMVLALFSFGASNRVGLDQLARRRGLRWGAAISVEALQQPDLVQLLLANVGSITPENAFKWAATEPRQGQLEWKAVDQLMQFARRHQLQLRGHTLVWHEQLPGWLTALPADARAQALKAHITRLMQHTRGAVSSWDVINEPIDPEGNGLRDTIWSQTLGADYIGTVLQWARAADPQARLFINDYGLEGDDPQTLLKRRALLDLIDSLQRRQVPLDGIGLQAHLLAPPEGSPPFTTLPGFLKQLRQRGLLVEVTELDVSDREVNGTIATRDRQVAATYQAFLQAVLSEPALQRITSWGLSDRETWLNRAFPRRDGQPQRPLPFDTRLQPKLALHQIDATIRRARSW